MVKIIEQKDYKTQSDDKTIINIEPDGFIKGKKAFLIANKIWVIPEMFDCKNYDPTSKNIIVKSNKIDTDEERSKFLQTISMLFNRINSTTSGKKLLKLITSTAPLLQGLKNISPQEDIIRNYVYSSIKSISGKNHDANVIIYRNKNNNLYIYNQSMRANNYNILSQIYFDTNFMASVKKKDDIYYLDPSLALYHELVHSLHYLYDIYFTGSLEEYITVNGIEEVKNHKNFIKDKERIFYNISNIAYRLNNFPYSLAEKRFFANKYKLKENNGIYYFDTNNFDELLNTITNCTEDNFAKELNQTHRESYFESFFMYFEANLFDTKIYNQKNGFVNGQRYSKNKFKIYKEVTFKNHPDVELRKKEKLL